MTSDGKPNVSLSPTLLSLAISFYLLTLAIFTIRISVRLRNKKLGFDDLFASAAMAGLTGYLVLYIVAVRYGKGRHQVYLTEEESIIQVKLSLFIDELYVWGVTFVKLSLGCILIRIQSNLGWRVGIYGLMGGVAITAVLSSVVIYSQCKPLRSLWDPARQKKDCISRIEFRNWAYLASGLFFLADIILSCLPFVLLRNMRLRMLDKVLVCGLMALGLLTTGAIIPKILSLRFLDSTDDLSWVTANISMWSFMEVSLGLIACCGPALKRPVERSLRKLRLLPSRKPDEILGHLGKGRGQPPKNSATCFNGEPVPHIGVIDSCLEDGTNLLQSPEATLTGPP